MTELHKTNSESQLQVAIGMLLESLSDKSALVSETVVTSIRKLSTKHSNQILNLCCNFCKSSHKPTNEHIASILMIMEIICTDYLIEIDGDTILMTIDFCLEIMIQNVNHEPIIQTPASNVLVALGRKHHIQVTDNLLKKLEIGKIPHYMIPHTLGALAYVNANGVVPYLKNILSIMLPLFGGLKSDQLKQSFAYAVGTFCDALIEYTSNIEQVPDNTITIENYQSEINIIYDILFTSWLHSRDIRVIESVLNALTSILPILTVEKITQQTPRIIQTLLNLYKKPIINSYLITKCLNSIIKKAANVNGQLLEPLLIQILQNLFELICIRPDYAKPELLRNHSEVLRCYECLTLYFTDYTIDQLINQLKNNNEKEKIKSLIILTHLISYSNDEIIQKRFNDIIKQLNDILNDTNIYVKKGLLKIIVALVNKGIFFNNKDINTDNIEKYMEFILKLSCYQQNLLSTTNLKNNEINLQQELYDLQKLADNTLCMLSTSIPQLESVLWKLLINNYLLTIYDDSIIILLRCLLHLINKRDKIENFHEILIRSLTLLSTPLPSLRGTFILNFLKNIPLDFNDNNELKLVWDSKILQLNKYLEQNFDNLHQNEWNDLIFNFVTILLENINDEKFNELLILAAKKQLHNYNVSTRNPLPSTDSVTIKQNEKHFLLKCLAIILCNINEKELVLQSLDNILVNVKLTDFNELNACAEAVGICSRIHLKYVLDKLSLIRKDILLKKSTKFFQFLNTQKADLGIERIRYVIIASYSEICEQSTKQTDKLLKIIESEILEFVLDELNNCKDFIIRRICLKAIGNIADVMHPNRNLLHIRMLERDKVLEQISSQIHLHSGQEYIELFPIIISVITSLVRLPSILEFEQRFKLLKLCFDSVFNASAIYCKISLNDSSYDNNYYGDLKLVPYITNSFIKLNQLVQEILLQNISPATLDEIVVLLQVWLNRKRAEQRLPAIETLRILLQTYLDNMRFAYDTPTNFNQTGALLAQIVPRCTDPNKNIRKVAVECLGLVLCISTRYEGHVREHDKKLLDSLKHIQQQIDSDEPKLLFNLTTDLAHVICNNLPHFQLYHFVNGLINALVDCETSSANGSSVVLNVTLKNKGGELQIYVTDLMEKIIIQLNKIKCPRTKSSTLRSVLNFTVHHPRAIGQFLLNQPLPFDESICDCWAVLSTDSVLVTDLIDQIKKIVKQTALYYEDQGNNEIRIANLQPLQAISVLHELVKNSQLKEMFQQQFSELFSLLLITLASYIGTTSPAMKTSSDKKEKYSFIINRDALKLKPAKIALETFKLFLLCCEYNQIANCLLSFTNIETNEEFPMYLEIISNLVQNICEENPKCLSWLIASLAPFIRADIEEQRVAVIAFFTYLIRQQTNDQTVFIENLLEMILDVQMDQSCLVRKIALQGLGFAAEYLNVELISRHCNPILSVLMNSLDYNNISNESEVILEGMLSFSKLITALDGHKFSSCQVTAAVRIKPLLDQEDVQLRRASFRLLGDLALSLGPDANMDAFKEQIQGNLITLLLHLCDPDIYVIKACKHTLRQVVIYLNSPKVNSMIQEHLIDEANLHYTDFIRDLIKLMAEELQDLFNLLVMTSLSYLKSPWVEIRSNAAFIAGLLYYHTTLESKHRTLLDTVCDKLMRLLNDEHEEVRMRAVQAISYLFID